MWLEPRQTRKWRPDSLESRIYAMAEAEAHANGLSDAEAAGEAMEAVFQTMRWCQSTRSYKTVAEMVEEAWGVETSQAALSGFWRRFCSPYLAEVQRRHARLATELADTITPEEEAGLERRVWQSVREMAFEALHSPEGNEKMVIGLLRSLIQKAKGDAEDRKIALLEAKAAFADEVKKAAAEREGGLTAEDMAEIERRLKLM